MPNILACNESIKIYGFSYKSLNTSYNLLEIGHGGIFLEKKENTIS